MPQQILPWSLGLNRATGAPSQDPSGFAELNNALLLDATLRLRPATGPAAVTIADVDQVCFIGVFEGASLIIYVTYTESSRSVDIYTADLQGNNPTLLGNWGTLADAAASPPCFSIAESFSILILAHDEENVANRLTTQVFDPSAMTELYPLQADLVNDDPMAAADVKFRWVATHYSYILGGGFGNADQASRPELVRLSHPDDPTKYDSTDYVIFGELDVPVVGGRSIPTGQGTAIFVVGKPGQLWRLLGSSRTDWQPDLLDPTTGCANHRAFIQMEGYLYFWSSTGPYVTDGQTCTAAGLELDLPNAYPADLPAMGPSRLCWALALPDDRHVVFWHPDSTQTTMLGFAMSARNPQSRRWGTWTMPTAIHGAAVSTGFAFSTALPGYADPVTTSGSSGLAVAQITTIFTPVNAIGDETVELWYKPAAGSWSLVQSFPIDTSSPTQSVQQTTGVAAGSYDVAVRFKRQGRYDTGYESSNPDDWPSGSKASGTVVVIPSVTALTSSYSFTTGELTIGWTVGDPSLALQVQLIDATLGPQGIIDLPAATASYVFDALAMQPFRDAGSSVQVEVRHKSGSVVGSWAFAPVSVIAWVGADRSGCSLAVTGNRTSVALGTDFDISIGVPDGVVGDWDFELDSGANLGTYPPNGGCGLSFPIGGGYFFPSAHAVNTPVFSATYPDSETSPVVVTHIQPESCAKCLIVGQVVGMGSYLAVWRYAKAGTLVHRTSPADAGLTGYLPGSNAGFAVGVVCTT